MRFDEFEGTRADQLVRQGDWKWDHSHGMFVFGETWGPRCIEKMEAAQRINHKWFYQGKKDWTTVMMGKRDDGRIALCIFRNTESNPIPYFGYIEKGDAEDLDTRATLDGLLLFGPIRTFLTRLGMGGAPQTNPPFYVNAPPAIGYDESGNEDRFT